MARAAARWSRHRPQIGDPDDRQPDIDIPFGLGIFAALGNAEQIARRGEHDEQLVAPEDEFREPGKGQPRATGPLDHIETGRDQRVATKRENHRRGMDRAQPPEIQILAKVEIGKHHLRSDDYPDEETNQAPEDGGNHAEPNDIVVVPAAVDRRRRGKSGKHGIIGTVHGCPGRQQSGGGDNSHVNRETAVGRADAHE